MSVLVITDALAGTGEGGYIRSSNELDPSRTGIAVTAPNQASNFIDVRHQRGTSTTPSARRPRRTRIYWLNTDMPRSTSARVPALSSRALTKYFRPDAQESGPARSTMPSSRKGDSMLAEDLVSDPSPPQHLDTPRYSFSYLHRTVAMFSLTSFTGYRPNPTSTAIESTVRLLQQHGGKLRAARTLRPLPVRSLRRQRAQHDQQYARTRTQRAQSPPATVHPIIAAAGTVNRSRSCTREFATAARRAEVHRLRPRGISFDGERPSVATMMFRRPHGRAENPPSRFRRTAFARRRSRTSSRPASLALGPGRNGDNVHSPHGGIALLAFCERAHPGTRSSHRSRRALVEGNTMIQGAYRRRRRRRRNRRNDARSRARRDGTRRQYAAA